MQENHIIPVSNGLFDHRERIGSAIWEFLWCIDAITAEEIDGNGVRWWLVHGGVPVKHERIAEETGCSIKTAQRNMSVLKKEGYIKSIRVFRGEIVKVSELMREISIKLRQIYFGIKSSVPYKKIPIPKRVKWEIWERDDFTCQYCGARKNLTVDHIVPESVGGTLDPSNLVTACTKCNSKKGARTPEQAKMILLKDPRDV